MKPLVLAANPVQRFYRGGPRIAALRGEPPVEEHVPEDWVGSTTAVHGSGQDGLSSTQEGALLADLVASEPEAYLGPRASVLALLVKLLDAGERLPVHLHPDGAFARERLGAPRGKTEAWYVVSADDSDPCVWLGFRHDVDDETLAGWVERQDTEALLDALHRIPVSAGDALFVPAGLPHAIGEGLLICELQEPSDLSVLLEWRGFDLGGADPYLGLGVSGAVGATRREPLPEDELERLGGSRGAGGRPGVERLLPPEADAFFRLERIRPSAGSTPLPPELSVLVVLDGQGRLVTEEGELALRRGATALVPWGAGSSRLEGELDVLRCLPPELPS